MTLKELKRIVQSAVSIADNELLLIKINAAAREIWNSIDLPGFLEEDYFEVPDVGYITLPYRVYSIRGVKICDYSLATELHGPVPAYGDSFYMAYNLRWRILKTTPLEESISEATTLKFTAYLPEAADVDIYMSGPTDTAARINEKVTLKAGNTSVTSVNRFTDLYLLEKSARTASDIIVTDGADKRVAYMPSHILEARNTLIEVGNTTPGVCVAVLYKPYLPPLIDDLDTFPEPYGHALAIKVLEWLKIDSKDELDHAGALAVKSSSLVERISADSETGLIKPVRNKRNSAFFRADYSAL